MKKLLLFLCILTGINGFGQISVRTQTTPTQLTAGNGTVVVKSGTTNVNVTSTVSLLPTLLTNTTTAMKKGIDTTNQTLRRLDLLERYANGKLDSIKGHLFNTATGESAANILRSSYVSQYATENHLSNIYFNGVIGVSTYEARINRKLDSLINYTRYNNNKQDSMISQQTYTTMTFTVTSANTNSAVVAGQTIGNGTYSLTIPTGNWQIIGATCTHSLQSSASVIRMFLYQGATNIATQAEGSTYSIGSFAALDELKAAYNTTTGAYVAIAAGSTGAFSYFSLLGQGASYQDGIISSGTLKVGLTHGASYTPPLNPQYVIRIRLRRVN